MKSGRDHARILLEKAGNDLKLAEIGLEHGAPTGPPVARWFVRVPDLARNYYRCRCGPAFAPSQIWESVTPYCVTRHVKDVGVAEALSSDIRVECHRRGLPEPRVVPRELRGLPGIGLVGTAHLTFEVVNAAGVLIA